MVTPEGSYLVRDGREADDVLLLLTECYADRVAEPLVALSRQQVAARLGRGLPADFPPADVVAGDPNQSRTRLWWESSVQRYLREKAAPATEVDTPAEQGHPGDDTPAPEEQDINDWPLKSRQWTDVDLSGVDQRVLLAGSRGLVSPSGVVKSGPLRRPERLGEVVCNRKWATPAGGMSPQIWITPEALDVIGFPIDGLREDQLVETIGDFFGCTVGFHQSGWFACEFDSAVFGGDSRKADIILMPFLALDPSTARPLDRGMAGIQGDASELPDDEDGAIHLLGDRIAWLYSMEGCLPAPRWTMVGAQLLDVKTRKAKPKTKSGGGPAPELKISLLPAEISSTGRLTNQWWIQEGVEAVGEVDGREATRPGAKIKKTKHRSRGQTIDVELDQQAAYLPSAEGLYLGFGTPGWVEPDPSVFNDPRPPFGIYQVTTPAGNDLDLHRKLPLPHPLMSWEEPATWWATTADVRHLTAAAELGGAGIAWAELDLEAAWVWPEQHQWLKGFGQELRSKRIEAVKSGRDDYEEMTKAIYTSTLGRMSALGDTAWKHPYFKYTQPAWYASIEAVTRARAMKYAVRIARDHGQYPIGWWADAWFYRVPAGFDISQLEDPLRDGVRTNGSYRIKNVDYPASDT
ncbi:hypothetical protein A5658_12920 [Mycobacterium sp. 1245111.1]|nr:hypothetical protein A5658_12920 [Mycobacterium sp. 1245111.1]